MSKLKRYRRRRLKKRGIRYTPEKRRWNCAKQGNGLYQKNTKGQGTAETMEKSNAVSFVYSRFLYSICTDPSGDHAGEKDDNVDRKNMSIQRNVIP